MRLMRNRELQYQRDAQTVRRRTSPLVRKWLREYEIDPSHVVSDNESDRLSKDDVQQFMAEEGSIILRHSTIHE
jgi:pyruvate/2-oxoglutarate dehydrogenase complex dihydrolipoamide acyltransferase (E2) component